MRGGPEEPDPPFHRRHRPDPSELAEASFIRSGIGSVTEEDHDAPPYRHRELAKTYRACNFDPHGPYGNRWN